MRPTNSVDTFVISEVRQKRRQLCQKRPTFTTKRPVCRKRDLCVWKETLAYDIYRSLLMHIHLFGRRPKCTKRDLYIQQVTNANQMCRPLLMYFDLFQKRPTNSNLYTQKKILRGKNNTKRALLKHAYTWRNMYCCVYIYADTTQVLRTVWKYEMRYTNIRIYWCLKAVISLYTYICLHPQYVWIHTYINTQI